MGCDIHAHLEVKINGIWHHGSMPNICASYALFTRMAGVRSQRNQGIEPIAEPRGLPEDATFLTKFCSEDMGVDGHSHSYLNAKELADLIKWHDERMATHQPGQWYSWEHECLGYFCGNGWDITSYPDENPKGVEDVRIVFWFDN